MVSVEILRSIIPPEKIGELKEKREELKARLEELRSEIQTVEQNLKMIEDILVELGELSPSERVTAAGGRRRGPSGPRQYTGVSKEDVKKYVLNYKPGTKIRFSAVVRETGASRGTVYQALRELLSEGKLKKEGVWYVRV